MYLCSELYQIYFHCSDKAACLAGRLRIAFQVAFIFLKHTVARRVPRSISLVWCVVREATGGFDSVKVLQQLEILGLVVAIC